jgi:hypothetical protein
MQSIWHISKLDGSAWGTVLVLVVPATIAAVFVATIIEQLLSSHLAEGK